MLLTSAKKKEDNTTPITKTIPQNVLIPLTEISSLLAELSPSQEQQPLTVFKQIIQAMDKHSNYFFDTPWPQDYNYKEASTFSPIDMEFINAENTDDLNPVYLPCIRKNINYAEGISVFGFIWALIGLGKYIKQNMEEPLIKLVTNASIFAKVLLNWETFDYQEKLLADTSNRILCCWGRQTGKTTTVAVKAIHYAYFNPATTTLVASPSLRQSMILFKRIQNFIKSSLSLTQAVARKTQTTIELQNNSRIVALPCSENLLRGYTADLVICDEAAYMPENAITEIIFPMLSATNGTAIMLSTPWGKDHFFHKAYTSPGYSVHHVQSTQCPRIKPNFLQEQQRVLTKEAYQREYRAEFTEAANAYFPQDLISTCIDNTLELITDLNQPIPHGEYYAGADFGKLNDHSTIAIIKRQDDNRLKLVYLHEFPLNTPYSDVIGHLNHANQAFHTFQKVLVDQTGIGEPITEEIKAQDIQNVQGVTFTTQTKEAMLTRLKLAMEQKQLSLPYHRRLITQINQQQYAYAKNGHLTFTHPPNTHDDQLWALALAMHAATQEITRTLTILK